MRNFRLLLACASFTTMAIGGLVACGDDDSSSSSGTPGTSSGTSGTSSGGTSGGTSGGNGTSGGTSGNPADTGAKPTAAAIAVTVYLGQTATLDGSGSAGSGLTYAWALTPPAASKVTTASLKDPTTAKPTFVPDVVGTYTANLTVTAGGQTATATATLEVVDATVFYFTGKTSTDGTPNTATVNTANLTTNDGGSGKPINCFASDGGALALDSQYSGEMWSDWWEAPAGQPSKMVYMMETNADGGASSTLLSTTSEATCATAPIVLDGHPGVPLNTGAFEIPRISPDGTRVVYMTTSATNQTHVTTIALDGSNKHDVAPRGNLADGASDPDGGRFTTGAGPGARPVWIDATHVAWLQQLDAKTWQIVKTTDADTQTPALLLSCTGTTPLEFDILASGEIIVSQSNDDADANARAKNLVAYTADAMGKCGAPRKITNLTSNSGHSEASSFSLSPDKSRVAYYVGDDTGAATAYSVFVTNVDGASDAVRVGVASSNVYGPRWVAGGTALTWGVDAKQIDGGSQTSIAVVSASLAGDAGERLVASASAGTVVSTVNNSTLLSCGISYGFGSAASGVGFLGLLGLGITRRRRAKK